MENDLINKVRQANDIVEVITSYMPLEKKGKNYFGICPFHDDTNPSMSVSKEKQIYKCFSCGASGNVFNFVMDYEKVDFRQALEILAKKSGIAINNIKVKNNNKYEKYYEMYEIALKLYQNNLNSTYAKEAKEYLEKRKINEELIKTFKIGLALKDKEYLTKILLQKGYTLKEMEQYGLGNGTTDIFMDRIMFPLFDITGKVVGFSGRIYRAKSDSKYINTKETPIFTKGNLLFHYYESKEYVRDKKYVIIVEGFMDVIRLASIGIYNTVALMGTSLTKEHITLLKRLSNNIYLCLDSDNAGRHGMFTVGKKLEEENFKVSVVLLKEDLDPDEYIIKYGKDDYLSLLQYPIDFSDYKLSYLKDGKTLTSIDEQTAYLNEAIKEVSNEQDVIKQQLLLQKLSFEFKIDIEILKNKLQNNEKYSKINSIKTPKSEIKTINKYQKATEVILNAMLNSKKISKIYEKNLNYLPSSIARYLANEIIHYYHLHDTLSLADFFTSLNDKKELEEYLKSIINSDFDYNIDETTILDYIAVIKGYENKERITRLKEKMSNEQDPIKKAMISEEIRKCKIGVE